MHNLAISISVFFLSCCRYSKGEHAQAAISNLDGKQLENSILPLNVRVAEDHGRQKAQYIENLNQSYVYPRGKRDDDDDDNFDYNYTDF